jgi:class 3 adenylate cyclase
MENQFKNRNLIGSNFLIIRLLIILFLTSTSNHLIAKDVKQLLKEIELAEKKDKKKAAILTIELAETYLTDEEQQNFKLGIEAYKSAISLCQGVKDVSLTAKAQEGLGMHFFNYKQYEQGISLLYQAAKDYREVQNWDKVVDVLYYLGISHFEMEHYKVASEILATSLKVADEYKIEHKNFAVCQLRISQAKKKLGFIVDEPTPIQKEAEELITEISPNLTDESEEGEEEIQDLVTEDVMLLEQVNELEVQREEELKKLEEIKNTDSVKYSQEVRKLERKYLSEKKDIEEQMKKRIEQERYMLQLERGQKNKILLYGAIAVTCLVLLLFFALVAYLQTRKFSRKLKLTNEELSAQKEEIETQKEEIERQKEEIESRSLKVEEERKKADKLLLNILPIQIAEELKEHDRVIPKTYPLATILFTDFKGFTQMTEILKDDPSELVEELDTCFKAFDRIITNHKLEKIKTIGDAYMCVGGVPVSNTTHPIDAVRAALDMQNFMEDRKFKRQLEGKFFFEVRIGIHTGGPLVAGVVGEKKFAFDVWGDAVNTGARMESSGEPTKINISGDTYEFVKHHFYCSYRGKIQAKNKGEIDMYFVNGEV